MYESYILTPEQLTAEHKSKLHAVSQNAVLANAATASVISAIDQCQILRSTDIIVRMFIGICNGKLVRVLYVKTVMHNGSRSAPFKVKEGCRSRYCLLAGPDASADGCQRGPEGAGQSACWTRWFVAMSPRRRRSSSASAPCRACC